MNKTEVAIVGAGPVGALLAIMLGKQGRKVTVVEKWPSVYDRPRAVTMDHEVARILATLGIDCNHDPAIEYHDELYYWRDARREDLQIVDWKSVSPSGWRVTYWFNQPELEARLLKIAASFPGVRIMRGWEAVELGQNPDYATLRIRETRPRGAETGPETGPGIGPETGTGAREVEIRADFVVGCDGANSFVRRELGIPVADKGYFFDWLILDLIPDRGYSVSPAQWQLCDPARPTTIVPGGPGRRRWEFMVLPGETSEEIAKPENAWRLLEPWGLSPENAELERSAVYRFQANWAEKWRDRRCLIAGDAAHLMPPFAGEGMCAGLRDAVSLGWRLNMILDGKAQDALLDSYESERIHHAKHYIEFSQELGKIICVADPQQAAERDRKMKADLKARNYEPISGDLVHLGPGAWCDNTPAAGGLSVQGIVAANGTRGLFDQVVGHGWIIAGLNADPAAALTARQLKILKFLGGKTVKLAGFKTAESKITGSKGKDTTGDREEALGPEAVIDLEGTYAKWLSEIQATWFILRPDFYIAATASTGESLQEQFERLIAKLFLCKSACPPGP